MGRIVTFYSYKGGVGRSMALANVAVALARWHSRVLVVDWDLEAPGIEVFFKGYVSIAEARSKPGVIDLLDQFSDETQAHDQELSWSKLILKIGVPDVAGEIDLITSGERSDAYFKKVRRLDLGSLYERQGGHFIERLRNEWKDRYDFVLVDSRTGITDIGGICTVQLPDILVLLFTATEQSLAGIVEVAGKARRARRRLPFDRTGLRCLPIASRIDTQEELKAYGSWLKNTEKAIEPLTRDWLPRGRPPKSFLEATRLPYIPYYSFGERLALVEQRTEDAGGLGYAYESMASLIANDVSDVERFLTSRDSYLKEAAKQHTPASPDVTASVVGKGGLAKVFVSYSQRQGEWVWDRLVPVLKAGGAEVLIDRERFEMGKAITGQMDVIQDQSGVHLLMLSPDYLDSRYCRHEMNRAIDIDPDFSNGTVIPVLLADCKLPNRMKPGSHFVDLRNDRNNESWSQLLDRCAVDLGVEVTHWLDVRDELRRDLEEDRSVNLVVQGRHVAWRSMIQQLAEAPETRMVLVDLYSAMTIERPGLLSCMLDGVGTRHLPPEPGDLREFQNEMVRRTTRSRVGLMHFDQIQHRNYGVDYLNTLRYLVSEQSKLTLLIQSRAPFLNLLPPVERSILSHLIIATTELKGHK